MNRARLRLRISALALLAAIPLSARGGTPISPEIADPSGDAFSFTVGGAYAPWADLTSVWFSSVRDASRALTAFKVHIETVSASQPEGVSTTFEVNWSVGYCNGDLDVGQPWSTNINLPGEASFHEGPEHAVLRSSCESQEGNTTELQFERDGSELVVTVPLSIFSGVAAEEYADGAYLRPSGARSIELPCSCPPTLVDEAPDFCLAPEILGYKTPAACPTWNPYITASPAAPGVFVLGS